MQQCTKCPAYIEDEQARCGNCGNPSPNARHLVLAPGQFSTLKELVEEERNAIRYGLLLVNEETSSPEDRANDIQQYNSLAEAFNLERWED